MSKRFCIILAARATSIGLFLVGLCLLWVGLVSAAMTAAYFWIAPALLFQSRAPSEAVCGVGVAPPDSITWALCFLFWGIVGGLIHLAIRLGIVQRKLAVRRRE